MYNSDNKNVFFTDSNGLEMQKRVLNKRPDFNFSSYETVSSNYYPVNSAIVIRDPDEEVQMTIMTDRS